MTPEHWKKVQAFGPTDSEAGGEMLRLLGAYFRRRYEAKQHPWPPGYEMPVDDDLNVRMALEDLMRFIDAKKQEAP